MPRVNEVLAPDQAGPSRHHGGNSSLYGSIDKSQILLDGSVQPNSIEPGFGFQALCKWKWCLGLIQAHGFELEPQGVLAVILGHVEHLWILV